MRSESTFATPEQPNIIPQESLNMSEDIDAQKSLLFSKIDDVGGGFSPVNDKSYSPDEMKQIVDLVLEGKAPINAVPRQPLKDSDMNMREHVQELMQMMKKGSENFEPTIEDLPNSTAWERIDALKDRRKEITMHSDNSASEKELINEIDKNLEEMKESAKNDLFKKIDDQGGVYSATNEKKYVSDEIKEIISSVLVGDLPSNFIPRAVIDGYEDNLRERVIRIMEI